MPPFATVLAVALAAVASRPSSAARVSSEQLQRPVLEEGPSLEGAWVRKRRLLRDRHYDVILSEDGLSYEAFPITSCLEEGSMGLGLTSMRCDSYVRMHVLGGVATKSKVREHDNRLLKITACGEPRAVGLLKVNGFHNGRPAYSIIDDEDVIIRWSRKGGGMWRLFVDDTMFGYGRKTLYYSSRNERALPEDGWESADDSKQPPVVVNTEVSTGFADAGYSKLTVTNCGNLRVNGELTVRGYHKGRPEYVLINDNKVVIHWSRKLKAWRLFVDNKIRRGRPTLYKSVIDQFTVPHSGWEVVDGDGPAPAIQGTDTELHERSATAELPDDNVNKLVWSDGSVWERYSGPQSRISEWGNECHELAGPDEEAQSFQYSMSFAVSAGLTWSNLPGINVEFVQCFSNEWLSAHVQQFQCIMDKAGNETSSLGRSTRQSIMDKALKKVSSVLPGKGSGCSPLVCLGIGFPVFPLPSPIPSVFMINTWPHDLDTCNGVSLKNEIEDSSIDIKPKSSSKWGTRHGVHMTLFPIPSVSYFTSGARDLSPPINRTDRPRLKWDQVDAKRSEVLSELDAAIRQALVECPILARRFRLHQRSPELVKRLPPDASREEELRQTAALFPELAGKGPRPPADRQPVGFTVGGFVLAGTGGVAAGVFGGPSFQGRTVASRYKGCSAWKNVMELWEANPVLELDPREEQELQRSI